jgi:hypothetical protein
VSLHTNYNLLGFTSDFLDLERPSCYIIPGQNKVLLEETSVGMVNRSLAFTGRVYVSGCPPQVVGHLSDGPSGKVVAILQPIRAKASFAPTRLSLI